MGPHWSFLIFAFHPDTTNVHTLQWSLDLSFMSFLQQNFEWWNSQSCHYCHKYCLNGQAVKGQHFLVWCSNNLSDDLVSFLPFLQQELEELLGTSCPAGAGIYTWKSFKTVHLFYSLLSLCLKNNWTWFWCACSFPPLDLTADRGSEHSIIHRAVK